MILKQIKLHNIRSYLNETVDFPAGAFMLSGDIGSGKTTILSAVEFALFGLMRSVLDGDMLLRHGKQNGGVELKLEIDGREIIIKRNLKRIKDEVRQDSGYMIVDGSKIEATAIELKSKVLELLGYPKELLTKSKFPIYRYTIYTPQEEMKQILLEEPDYRIDTLRKIFQIDKYKRIRDNSLILLRELKERASEYNAKIEDLNEKLQQKEETKKELEALGKNLERTSSALDGFVRKISESKEKLKKLEQEINLLKELKEKLKINENKLSAKNQLIANSDFEFNTLSRKIVEDEERLAAIKIEQLDIGSEEVEKNLASKEHSYYEIIEKNTKHQEELRSLNKELTVLENEVGLKLLKIRELFNKKNFLEELKIKLNEKEDLRKSINDSEFQQKKLEGEINKLKFLIENSEKAKEMLDSDKCPLCQQDIPEEHKKHFFLKEEERAEKIKALLSKLTNEQMALEEELLSLKEKRDRLTEMEKEAEVLKAEIISIEEIQKDYEAKKNLIAELQKRKELLEKEGILDTSKITSEISELKKLITKINESRIKISEAEHLKRLVEERKGMLKKIAEEKIGLEKELKELKSEISELNRLCSGLVHKEKESESEKAQIENLEQEERLVLVEKASIEKEASMLEKSLAVLDSEISRKEKIKVKIKSLKQMQNWIEEYFINLMLTMERHVMLTIHNEFNKFFREWFNVLMEEELIDVRLDEEFAPVIEQNGFETNFENLSGGERTSCALAYRLALNKVINDFMTEIKTKDIIILDEPTDGFSEEQLDKVKEVIEQLNIKQVIIVSHEAKVESFVDKVIRIEKQEHVSRVAA